MKNSQELVQYRLQKLEEKRKQNQEQINKEMLELEKSINKYESSEMLKEYFEVPILFKSDIVKNYIKDLGFVDDKVSRDIPVNTSRIWISQVSFDKHVNELKIPKYSIKIGDIGSGTKINEKLDNENNKCVIDSDIKTDLNNNTTKQVDEGNKLKSEDSHVNRLNRWNKNEDYKLSNKEKDMISDLVKTLYNAERLYF